ncbi:MAG: 30S ribosome-binding factor RbfA [Sphingomonadaceae bacterium]|uniref:30S ribosome-binding factor RbfA n=1 Tax=Thermaurantiacus sp. TaxID=2820283 RepID=UPI00298F161E|nr:30S ribosome-binding factor RbfA [Thermaurantiacus sp.]MCS6987272.1 30S ribosome-binding factor RbfA [Sphingomonadaceae bacterium]MDW8414492.1 30S ribosome-binding factor RbfA [Thermaurantiacus sp.]
MKRATDPEGRPLRTLRVGEAIRHALAELLARGTLRDERLDRHIVSISEVRVSPDLRHATAFVMPVGADPAGRDSVVEALNAQSRRIRAELARVVRLKWAVQIRFRLDQSFDEGARIDALLRRVASGRQEGQEGRPRGGPEDPEGGAAGPD